LSSGTLRDLPDVLALVRPFVRRIVRRLTCAAIARLGAPTGRTDPTDLKEFANSVERILIIRLDLLGDVAFTLACLAPLRARYPRARISIMTLPYTAGLAELYLEVDDVIALDTNLIRTPRSLFHPRTWVAYVRVLLMVRRRRYDVAISVSGQMASLCARLSGARRTIGYLQEAYPHVLTDSIPGGRYAEPVPEVRYVMRLLEGLGVESGKYSLPIIPELASTLMNSMLAAEGIVPEDRLLVVHAGSGVGSAKRWPEERWQEFLREMGPDHGVRLVIIGSAGDMPLVRRILNGLPFPVVSLVGRTDVALSAAVIKRADVVVSADSGPLHLAVALQTPVVGLYGPTDPAIYGPQWGHGAAVVLRHGLPCSPCYRGTSIADCPLGDPVCMRLIEVPRVVRAVRALLA